MVRGGAGGEGCNAADFHLLHASLLAHSLSLARILSRAKRPLKCLIGSSPPFPYPPLSRRVLSTPYIPFIPLFINVVDPDLR